VSPRALAGLDLDAPPAPSPAVDKVWSKARAALQQNSFEGADAAFKELSVPTMDATTRDHARLARALLWASHGKAEVVAPVFADLAAHATTPAVRERAARGGR
jgi:hypothetical protein